MEHVPKDCSIEGCQDEATYWIDTSEGFTEAMLMTVDAPETFYLCDHHSGLLSHPDDDMYHHLRIDTGDIEIFEIGIYSCDPECGVCNQ